jgi:parallel beta-helix repeat protein
VGSHIINNIVCNNSGGIYLGFSQGTYGCSLVNNTVRANYNEGILLFYRRTKILMMNNNISRNASNSGIIGSESSFYDYNVGTSNLVNGKPIYLLKNETSLLINQAIPEMGYLALVGCKNVTVEDLTFKNNFNCLTLVNTESSNIHRNTIEHNLIGIEIINSSKERF